MLQLPDMQTGEDTLLLCLLSRRSKPVFSFRATSFYRRDGTDGSNWDNHPQRGDDVLTIAYRGGLMWSPDWYPAGSLETPYRRFAQVRARLGDSRLGEYVNRITHTEIGWRDAAGIIAPPNRSGQICFGPSVNLSPGCYMAIFWIVPNSESTDRIANGSLGHVDVQHPIRDEYLHGRNSSGAARSSSWALRSQEPWQIGPSNSEYFHMGKSALRSRQLAFIGISLVQIS